jgi:TetR/AcrR family transcriptional regulator
MQEEVSTEKRILEAAESVFLEEGYAGARMQHIADRAGINKAMLHYYYRSKDKLFELVFNYKLGQFLPQVTMAMQDPELNFIDKVDRFVMSYLGMLRKNPGLPLFIISTMNRNPEMMNSIKQKIGPIIIAAMQEEMNKGNIKRVDPHHFVLTLIGMCIFPFLARPIFRAAFDVSKEEYDQMIAERHLHVMQYARAILQT